MHGRTGRIPRNLIRALFWVFQNNEILVHRKHTRPEISQRPENGKILGFLIAIYSEHNFRNKVNNFLDIIAPS